MLACWLPVVKVESKSRKKEKYYKSDDSRGEWRVLLLLLLLQVLISELTNSITQSTYAYFQYHSGDTERERGKLGGIAAARREDSERKHCQQWLTERHWAAISWASLQLGFFVQTRFLFLISGNKRLKIFQIYKRARARASKLKIIKQCVFTRDKFSC